VRTKWCQRRTEGAAAPLVVMLSRWLPSQLGSSGPPTTNDEMVATMTRNGSISTPAVIAAFTSVDRGHFIDAPEHSTEEIRYINSPFRNGAQHLSAPCIYAAAMEGLELSRGCSFLNVCSGTGYLSALASQIVGTKAIHHAIEIKDEMVNHACTRLARLGINNVEFISGPCQSLCPETSMRFARIYLGAGADEAMASLLFRMLDVGGVLVGPFAGTDGSQRLLQARRVSEASYEVRELMSVQFTPILPVNLTLVHHVDAYGMPLESPAPAAALTDDEHASHPHPAGGGSHSTAPTATAPARLQSGGRMAQATISIAAPTWCPENDECFPPAHRSAVRTLLLIHNQPDSQLSTLPKELILQELLPKLKYDSFASTSASQAKQWLESGSQAELSEQAHSPVHARRASSHGAQGTENDDDDDDDDDDDEPGAGDEEPGQSNSEDYSSAESHDESENESGRSHSSSEASTSETERSRSERSSDGGVAQGEAVMVGTSGVSAVYRHAAIASHARRGWNRLLRCF